MKEGAGTLIPEYLQKNPVSNQNWKLLYFSTATPVKIFPISFFRQRILVFLLFYSIVEYFIILYTTFILFVYNFAVFLCGTCWPGVDQYAVRKLVLKNI